MMMKVLYEAGGIYDLMLLDLMLPKDGFTVLKNCIEKGCLTTPVLIMAAKESQSDPKMTIKYGFKELGAEWLPNYYFPI